MIFTDQLKNAWDVFLLFTIPIGGGIPAGVVLGNSRGLRWADLLLVYFLSDVLLAIVFESILHAFIHYGKKFEKVSKFNAILKQSFQKSTSNLNIKPGPFNLILIAFGLDPMSGRVITKAVGHGFFSGWAIAITGDLFFFLLVMASTLWLNHYLGDGTWTAIIITILMIGLPSVIQKVRSKKHDQTESKI